MGKLIVIEGCDCSGKETQSRLLVDLFNKSGISAVRLANPFYDTPTGSIIAACYLGKEEYSSKILKDGRCGLFEEGAVNVDSIAASLYYAADRRYNLSTLNEALDNNEIVVLDRYVYSNMAHQGGKFDSIEERLKYFKKMELLEFDICEMPRPDMVLFLYVSYSVANELKKSRLESADQHESSFEHLMRSEEVYLQLCDLYGFDLINCVKDDKILTVSEISSRVYSKVKKLVK